MSKGTTEVTLFVSQSDEGGVDRVVREIMTGIFKIIKLEWIDESYEDIDSGFEYKRGKYISKLKRKAKK